MAERRRSTIPSTALKRAAAASFREYDPEASESTTESESETERLERYPAKRRPSPRKTSSRMREQLKEVRVRATGKKAMRQEMEDEGRGIAVRTRRRVAERAEPVKKPTKELDSMPRRLPISTGVDEEDTKPGSGQVFVDAQQISKQTWDATMRARRAVVKRTDSVVDPSGLPKSDMGLFAMLPGELRNRIYRFALVEGDGEPFELTIQKNTCNLGPCIHMKMSTAAPGALSTCKQIRAEAVPIFAAENSFKFDSELVKARCVANWVRVIGPYANLLTKIVLDIVCWEVAAGMPAHSSNKVGVHYEMVLRWEEGQCHGKWVLEMDHEIKLKAASEYSVLDGYVDSLNREMAEGKLKEVALRDFVWSDWLAKLVYICRK